MASGYVNTFGNPSKIECPSERQPEIMPSGRISLSIRTYMTAGGRARGELKCPYMHADEAGKKIERHLLVGWFSGDRKSKASAFNAAF